jgi:hypothetical protein
MKRGNSASCIVVAGVLLSSSVIAAEPPAKRMVLLDVPGGGAVALRARVRERLASTTLHLLDDDAARLRLRGPAGAPLDVALVRTRLREADEAFHALEHERSVALLEAAIEMLELDRDFSIEKQELLEQARVTCAQRLVALAGPDETGKGETRNGKRARTQLAGVLRSNPTFSLDARRYPPKMRALLALASDDVKQAGMGSLQVRSSDPGAVVRVDGRKLGSTPLSLHEGLAAGRFRLWLESDGRRSFTRVIDVVADHEAPTEAGAGVNVEVDLGFESSMRPDDVGVQPSRPFSADDWRRMAGLLDVDVVALVGIETVAAPSPTSSQVVAWGAVVDGHTGAVVRGVRVALPSSTTTTTAMTAMTETPVAVVVDERLVALFRGGPGDDGFVGPAAVFSSSTNMAGSAASSSTNVAGVVGAEGGFPWLGVGVGVGVGLAAAVTTGLVLQATKTTTETFAVTVAEPVR